MKREVADFVARTVFKANGQITPLIPFLKEHADGAEEYEVFRSALMKIARTSAEEILMKIFEEHPELQQVIDAQMADFGRLP